MDIIKFYVDLFSRVKRQTPGSVDFTRKAFELTDLHKNAIDILDIGCGTGEHTLELASFPGVEIYAVDNANKFLISLKNKINKSEFLRKIKIMNGDMFDLPFKENQFDLIWAEGSIYIMGFENGLKNWKKFIKNDGHIVASEISWISENIPNECYNFWKSEYPEISTIKEKEQVINSLGFELENTLVVDDFCWMDNYYLPLMDNLDRFLEDNNHHEMALAVAYEITKEFEIYKKYHNYFSYVFYIMKLKQ